MRAERHPQRAGYDKEIIITKGGSMEQYHKDAMKIGELEYALAGSYPIPEPVIVAMSKTEIVDEAKYVLSLFSEGGHCLEEEINDEEDSENRRNLRKQRTALKRFIKKYI